VLVLTRSDDGTSVLSVGPGEIFLQPAASPGPDPFFHDPALVDELPALIVSQNRPVPPTLPSASADAVATVTVIGTEPGLYGGTRDNAACNIDAQIEFLLGNPAKAEAWGAVFGIAGADVPDFLRDLTPTVLLDDTRVTNHGFRNGTANPFQTVLQARTAVLIDKNGVPRARCACGNPLADPVAQASGATYRGEPWSGFAPQSVAVVVAGQPVDDFVLIDTADGTPFVRAAATDGQADVPAPPGALDDRSNVAPLGASSASDEGTSAATTAATAPPTTTTTAAPTTTAAAPTTTTTTTTEPPPPPRNITNLGAVAASSIFDPSFSAALAVDGSEGSSWFSAGPSGGATTFTWTARTDMVLSSVTIVGNAAHGTPEFRTGFGFGGVTVEFLDASGAVVESVSADLGGTPDPTVVVNFDGVARAVRLVFSGSEDPSCGGFSELIIEGRDA